MAAAAVEPRRCSSRNLGKVKQEDEAQVKLEQAQAANGSRSRGTKRADRDRTATTPEKESKRIKTEDGDQGDDGEYISTALRTPQNTKSPSKAKHSPAERAAALQAKKLKSFADFSNQSPFPNFKHPTPDECRLAHRILAGLHGERQRPDRITAPTKTAGCGNSPSVLDALVRTILSQNTSDKNSSRAKQSMDAAYGGSDKWDAIVEGGQHKLQKTIASGGLSVVKSRVIIGILEQVRAKYGGYSLDHLFEASDDEAMREMLSFQGVGPKTASCVLLFCLKRESFAVDTHVQRITGLLGWRPQGASREETHAHLDALIPGEEKYPLHVLLISHGKNCEECRAGGRNLGKCELRRAFRQAKIKGEAGDDVKEEELKTIKQEEG